MELYQGWNEVLEVAVSSTTGMGNHYSQDTGNYIEQSGNQSWQDLCAGALFARI